jgi:phosphoglycolate phosphatase-like HAD superfamily hydrolase
VENQAAWDALRRESSAEFLSEFHARFYLEREALRRDDLDAWLALLPPYSRFVDLLHRHQEDCILALATAKDRSSIELLLDAYSISSLFSDSCIVDKEAGLSKQAHLGLLQQRLDVSFEDMTFVDDKLNHLEDVAGLGVRGVLAAWGYNGERERTLALERGLVVCELDTAEEQLFGTPGGDKVPS